MDKALPLGGILFPSYVLCDSDLIRIEGDLITKFLELPSNNNKYKH